MNPHIEYTPSKFEMKMFQEMEGKYVSENEKVFFETMLRKIQTECASLTETFIDYEENSDELYLDREIYDDFIVGRYSTKIEDNPVEVNGLFRLLNLDLSEFKLFDEPITLWEWLRSMDYRCVHYDNWEG